MEPTDEILIKRYADGEHAALRALIDRSTPILYNFVVRFVGTTDAPDIVQEVFIKVWKNLKKFDTSKAQFKTWIFTIARNTITDYLRKRKQILFTDMDTQEESFAETIADTTLLPDEALTKIQDQKNLSELLLQLPASYQAVLILYYQEEMTFAEIGSVLGKPLNTVKSHHQRALKQLRQMIL